MFSHYFVGITDFDRAFEFYSPLMACLGIEQRFCDRAKPWAGWHSKAGGRPLFVIGRPFNGEAHEVGNGQMIAFLAKSREEVRMAYELSMKSGGISEGEPGLRTRYHTNYYGAYLRDPDGNKLCVVCHEPETDDA